MIKIERVILISTDENLNRKLNELLSNISDPLDDNNMEMIPPEDWTQTFLQNIDLYLINTSEINLSHIQSMIAPKITPVITLVDDLQQGIQSLRWGASDYLEKDKLTLSALEKALYLTLHHHQIYQRSQAEMIFYQNLVNGLPQSVYTKDKRGQLTFANQSLLNSVSMNLEEAQGKTVYDLYPLELAQKYDQDDQKVLDNQEILDVIENHQIPETEELKQVQVVKSPLYNSIGELIGTQGIFWDVSDRYKTEQALKQSEAKFRAFFEQAAVGMAIASIDGSILKVNQKLCELSGYQESELLEKTFLELTHPDEKDLTLEKILYLLQGEVNYYSLEKRYLHPDSQAIWTQVTTTLVKSSEGEPEYLVVILEDIQERKKAEEQLKYRLRLENAIANASQELVIYQLGNIKRVLHHIGLATDASRAYLVQFSQQGKMACMTHEWCAKGIKPDKLHFQKVDLSDFIWWRNKLNNHQNIIISSLEQLPPEARAEKYYLKSVGVNSVLAIPIFDYQGNLWGQLGLDTSQEHFKKWSDEDVHLLRVVGDMLYRQAEKIKEIKQKFHSNRRLKLLSSLTLKIRQFLEISDILQTAVQEIRKTFKADRVIFYRFNDKGSGQVVNESLITGISSLMNTTITDQFAWERCQEKYQNGYLHICGNAEQENYEPCYFNLLQKHQISAQIIVPILTSLTHPQSGIWGLLCVQMCHHPRQWKTEEIELLRQLSDQLGIALSQAQLREQEITQKKELARSNAELEQFAYIASHDLRQPLQIVADFAKLLQRRYGSQLDQKADQYINHIVLGSQRMEQQIEDLLQYSRVGRKEKVFEFISMKLVIQQAIANLQKTIEQSQAEIIFPEELPYLKADHLQLVQLFQNLIDNGIKYQKNIYPKIQINVQQKADHWQFSVQDNGIGIEEVYFERIFKIFQRLHTQDEYPGTGIGLAICQRIIQRHGGQIWLESSVDGGTTFYFTLPLLD